MLPFLIDGNDRNGDVRKLGAQTFEPAEVVEAGHDQIGEHEIEVRMASEDLYGLGKSRGLVGVVNLGEPPQDLLERLADHPVIVCDQNLHGKFPYARHPSGGGAPR